MKYKQLTFWEEPQMQNRLKSKVLWAAVVALLTLIMGNYGLYQYIGMTEEVFAVAADMVLGIFVLLGVINNPTDSQNY